MNRQRLTSYFQSVPDGNDFSYRVDCPGNIVLCLLYDVYLGLVRIGSRDVRPFDTQDLVVLASVRALSLRCVARRLSPMQPFWLLIPLVHQISLLQQPWSRVAAAC